jgi:hypothetical protein
MDGAETKGVMMVHVIGRLIGIDGGWAQSYRCGLASRPMNRSLA